MLGKLFKKPDVASEVCLLACLAPPLPAEAPPLSCLAPPLNAYVPLPSPLTLLPLPCLAPPLNAYVPLPSPLTPLPLRLGPAPNANVHLPSQLTLLPLTLGPAPQRLPSWPRPPALRSPYRLATTLNAYTLLPLTLGPALPADAPPPGLLATPQRLRAPPLPADAPPPDACLLAPPPNAYVPRPSLLTLLPLPPSPAPQRLQFPQGAMVRSQSRLRGPGVEGRAGQGRGKRISGLLGRPHRSLWWPDGMGEWSGPEKKKKVSDEVGRCSRWKRRMGPVLLLSLTFTVIYHLSGLWPAAFLRSQPCPRPEPSLEPPARRAPRPPAPPDLEALLSWPDTPGDGGDPAAATSPLTSTYGLRAPPGAAYPLGGRLRALLVARDHRGQPKAHGGDLFRARLYSPGLQAGAPGAVRDLGNGTYLLSFPLLWAGEARVEVKLIHSSEAVAVLRRVRRERAATVNFTGYFRAGPEREEAECNVEPPAGAGPVCRYPDGQTGETWFCARPRRLPCRALVGHSFGSYLKVTTKHDELLLGLNVTDKVLPAGISPIQVVGDGSLALPPRPPCGPGLGLAEPSGFYHRNQWTSLSCASRAFPTPGHVLDCLAGKLVHMIGDSTLRQWWEFLLDTVPSLKALDLHVPYQTGPLLAVDTGRGLVLQWRAHGWPLRSTQTPVASLHSAARELGGLAGGADTVVVLGLGAHFTTFPPAVFARRLAGVRAAVTALLDRAPATLVVVKTANTGYKSVYGSDWLTLQLNRLVRAVFSGLRVALLDTWDMTSCHDSPDNIHPVRTVVRNEVALFLSHVCPG
ncbi:NXPE family member 3-like [Tachyglossus aculeatus]|uniref:NXPE family member 3-like n=1 Tax=Tachyglossus aculeatus TaxID=9261 RepID=UPI0018F580B0|nr:NXPE family member 3-like [Tachyglossus aculeatus]